MALAEVRRLEVDALSSVHKLMDKQRDGEICLSRPWASLLLLKHRRNNSTEFSLDRLLDVWQAKAVPLSVLPSPFQI